MSWDIKRARERIEKHIARAPEITGDVSSLGEHRRATLLEARAAHADGIFPRSRGVLIKGVQMYGILLDFEDFIASTGGPENENLHVRMLQFLHAYYRVWGALVEDSGGFTVDFHGPRLHAVLAETDLDASEQIERAVALADHLTAAANEVGRALGLPSRTRFGIDYGTCVALTTGRAVERDTLFLGSPANHAAKITAADNIEGIYLSHRAQQYTRVLPAYGEYGIAQVLGTVVAEARQSHRFNAIESAVSEITAGRYRVPDFRFFRPTPPLSGMKFADLKPSRTARIGMAAMFADIDGYTDYVDEAIADGTKAVKKAALTIHVAREELNDVLQADFGGKRARFIGDSIQGMLADGAKQDDASKSLENSLLCAAGMRDSFDIVLNATEVHGALDLAVGIEYGTVAVSRIGAPGDDSIRCTAGRAIIGAERAQQSIPGGGIALGDQAHRVAPANASRGFVGAGRIPGYDDALNLLGSVAAPAVQMIRDDASARPHCRVTER